MQKTHLPVGSSAGADFFVCGLEKGVAEITRHFAREECELATQVVCFMSLIGS